MIFSKSNKRFGEIYSFKMKDTNLKGGGECNKTACIGKEKLSVLR